MSKIAWYQLRVHFVIVLLIIVSQFLHLTVLAQEDTLKLTVQQAEDIFLQNNLSLLAAKYNVDANRALIRQAKLWDNPVLSTDQNLHDQQGGFLKHDKNNGQLYVQVMQLIKTAGKRNKLAQLAEDNTTISLGQFDDLVRTLRYVLISDLYEINHQLKIKKVYDFEINELQLLVKGMDIQLQSGNISVKENIRIKALMFNLQNELVNVQSQIIPLQNEIKVLLKRNDSSFISPVLTYHLPDLINAPLPGKEKLLQDALLIRPDIRIAQSQLVYQKDNLVYQKAVAKPDLNVGAEFDQRSSYAPNYIGLAISFPLNILNKNQGNIRSAQFNIQQQQALVNVQSLKVEGDITTALSKAKFYQQVNNLQQLNFSQQYDDLFQNMLKSYKQRQVSLLEFIDFADAYKDTKLKILDQHTALIKSLLELNYQAGKDVINFK